MALVRWAPARELGTIQTEMSRLLNGSFFDTPTATSNSVYQRWIPAMDVVETDGDFALRIDLPGLSEQDVSVELEDNVLTISGERKAEHEERKQGYHRVERSSGAFRRSLTLPEGVDAAAVSATFDRGVLEVRVPKPEQRQPHKVAISVGGGSEPPAIKGSEHTDPSA